MPRIRNGTKIKVCMAENGFLATSIDGMHGTIIGWNENIGRYGIDLPDADLFLEYHKIYYLLPEHIQPLRAECVFDG